jgi:hypothetical protein
MRGLIFSILVSTSMLSAGGGQESSVDVCELLGSAKRFDGKVVLVSGFIHAGGHSEGIDGKGCSQGVAITYDIDSMPKDSVSAITDKRLRLDSRPLTVTVKGRFKGHVRAPLGYISRIEVTKAVHWEFIGEKTPQDHGP